MSHCSFTIEPGEIVGLVGPNGCGKSTIVKLLCRFYDPGSDEILIDGVSNKEYDIVKLRELFGVLFQDYVRYSFSLRENVALSKPEKSCDADILRACDQSRIDFMKDWKNGIDENLTRRFDPNGKELSGGQWQRISLARAFFAMRQLFYSMSRQLLWTRSQNIRSSRTSPKYPKIKARC